MKLLNFFTILMLMGLGDSAIARNFYRAQMDVTLHYSSLAEETEVLAKGYTLNVKYSDDHDFCRIFVGTQNFTCLTYHPSGEPEQATITINREEMGAVIGAIMASESMAEDKLEVWNRLAVYLSDTIDVEHNGVDFFQQVHDREAESFHLWLYSLSAGEKY